MVLGLRFLLLSSVLALAPLFARADCELDAIAKLLENRSQKLELMAADLPGSQPARRPKQINGNHRPIGVPENIIESADPTSPIPMLGKEGKTVYRWYASGTDIFEADSLEDILRGGDKNRRRITTETYYPDGVTKAGGSYHTGSHIWDRLAVKVKLEDMRDYRFAANDPRAYAALPRQGTTRDLYGNAVDFKLVGYGGMMEQPHTLQGAQAAGITERQPLVGQYNYTRSRHAFDINMENGVETWRSRGSMSHNKPGLDGQWVNDAHEHGYGGRPLMDENGYLKVWDGSPWLVYERVVEQKKIVHPDGRVEYLPWKTEQVARRMKNPYELFEKGEKLPDGRPADTEVVIASVNGRNGTPYPATDRHGMGYLFEGFNLSPKPVTVNGKKYWIGTGSPGNYVEDYGVVMGFRKFEDGPIGPYTLVTKKNGDLENSVADFAREYRLSWTGRADVFFDKKGKAWMIMHGVDADNLPANFPKTGWPSHEEFEHYFRNQYLVPIKIVEKDGMPRLIVDMDPPKPQSTNNILARLVPHIYCQGKNSCDQTDTQKP